MTDGTPRGLLNLELPPNDAGASTMRAYLAALAEVGFQEKRPFGSSGWRHELYGPMEAAGIIPPVGDRNEAGFLITTNRASVDRADALILAAIAELGKPASQ